jgi:hypothetical protein
MGGSDALIFKGVWGLGCPNFLRAYGRLGCPFFEGHMEVSDALILRAYVGSDALIF